MLESEKRWDIEETYLNVGFLNDHPEIKWDKDHPKYVVYSGGADSTLLLAEVGMFCRKNNIPVNVISMNMDVLDRFKGTHEREVRDKFIQFLKRNDFEVNVNTVNINWTKSESNICNPKLPQQFYWEMISLALIPKNSDVFFGFIKGDDVWSVDAFRQEIWRNAFEWLESKSHMYDPYKWYGKSYILQRLHALDLLDYTWSCESPLGDTSAPCGTCTPCQHRKEALIQLSLTGNVWADEILRKEYHLKISNDFESGEVIRLHLDYHKLLELYANDVLSDKWLIDTHKKIFDAVEEYLDGCFNNRFRFIIWSEEFPDKILAKFRIDEIDKEAHYIIGNLVCENPSIYEKYDYGKWIKEKGLEFSQIHFQANIQQKKPEVRELWFRTALKHKNDETSPVKSDSE